MNDYEEYSPSVRTYAQALRDQEFSRYDSKVEQARQEEITVIKQSVPSIPKVSKAKHWLSAVLTSPGPSRRRTFKPASTQLN